MCALRNISTPYRKTEVSGVNFVKNWAHINVSVYHRLWFAMSVTTTGSGLGEIPD